MKVIESPKLDKKEQIIDHYYMNPKSTANLDPKLREAYERIMGTTVPQAPPTQTPPTNTPPVLPQAPQQPNMPGSASKPMDVPPPPPPQAPEAPKLQVQEVAQEPLTISTPDIPFTPPTPEPISNEMVQSPESPVYNSKKNPFIQETPGSAINMVKNTQENIAPKKKGKGMNFVLTLGGLVFFVLYGVIWAKVFGLF